MIQYLLALFILSLNREAKRTLPRPKVGDFCTIAMEQGFADACVPLCTDVRPVSRVAQVCRSAAMEMPRPTVRKWCEHGYSVAYEKTLRDLRSHFKPDTTVVTPSEPVAAEIPPEIETPPTPIVEETPAIVIEDEPVGEITATIPVTLDDKTIDLNIRKGQTAEDAVVEFCKEFVNEDVPGCIRQLLPVVLERMEGL